MGRLQSSTMKLNDLLFSAAMAQDLQCYSCELCEDVTDDMLVSCPDGQCYTRQFSYSEVDESYYDRGCILGGSGSFEEGCQVEPIGDKEAKACYQLCSSDKCNSDTNINSSVSVSSSIFAAILCYMML